MSQIPYRPEIDGLRAVAVLSVLIYHAGFGFLPGGFMGVDIFFVLSGFLITSFIVQDIRAGKFSMVAFWERRARRILPPLFLVVGATLAAGSVLFLSIDYVQLGKEIASQAAFGSNILFMMQGGYFDDGDKFKALLHTWSLSVEEQFYLFYPIGLALFARFFGPKFFWLILCLGILSFALCIFAAGISPRLAFYALPFRGWELLAGALLAVVTVPAHSRWIREGLSIAGLGMIAAALLFYQPSFVFPGWFTVLPVVGAALIIYANLAGKTAVGSALSWKPMVGVGLISYSLYLWHWPVLIFARYVPVIEPGMIVSLACMTVSFVLAYLTWRYVEQPVRTRRCLATRKSMFLFSAAGLLSMAIAGAAIVYTKGMPFRFSEEVSTYADARWDENPHRYECDQPALDAIGRSVICQTNEGAGAPGFILWGDSFADAIAPAFYKASIEHKQNGYVVTGHGCPPIIGAEIPMPMRTFDCAKSNRSVLDLVTREKIKTVYLVGNWASYLSDGALNFSEQAWMKEPVYSRFERKEFAGLERTIDLIRAAGAQYIYVVYDVPYPSFDPPRALAQAVQFGMEEPTVPVSNYHADLERTIAGYRKQSRDGGVQYLEPESYLCDEVRCIVAHNGRSLYFNPGHLSAYGAELVAPMLERSFKEAR